MKRSTNKTIVILSGLLFISVAYNLWWVGYERSGNEKTIEDLNKYISLSADVFASYEDLYQSSGEYSMLVTESLTSCGSISFSEAEKATKLMESKLDEISVKKASVEELLNQREEFVKTTRLTKIDQ